MSRDYRLTRRRFTKLASVLVAAMTFPAATSALAAVTVIKGARVWRSPEKTRLVFDLSGGVSHKIFPLNNPQRLVIDIASTRLPGSLSGLDLSKTPISKIRWAARDGNGLRIVLDLKETVTPRSFVLKPNTAYGHRLVLDLEDGAGAVSRPAPKPAPPTGNRDIVIAIDAGHGGEDPGALGPQGQREKDIVLAVSKEVAALFKKDKGFRPVMVRTGDYYISLRGRTKKARLNGADFFVSIHADAFNRTSARGASVYTLSQRGASSETARWLANRENSADLIGGEDGVSLDDKDDVLASVLLDLSMTDTVTRSTVVGSKVLKQLGRVNRLHKRNVEQAAFAVLKSPDIPSILVETGFISNPKEARKLATKSHQRALARSIHTGIRNFFAAQPPAGTWVSNQRKQSVDVANYKVRSGDTLSGIATRHNVSLSQLMAANSMRRTDTLRVGQVIQIP